MAFQNLLLGLSNYKGEQLFTTPSPLDGLGQPIPYDFVVPPGINTLSAVCIGGGGAGFAQAYINEVDRIRSGGGGGGGGLCYGSFFVTPGETLSVIVGRGGVFGLANNDPNAGTADPGIESAIRRGATPLMRAFGGEGGIEWEWDDGDFENGTPALGGGYFLSSSIIQGGGGNGGNGGGAFINTTAFNGAGGGAGGYGGNGGNAAVGPINTLLTDVNALTPATAGANGGGGGGFYATTATAIGGGGTGLYIRGANGAAGVSGDPQGKGGSGGISGISAGGPFGGGGGVGTTGVIGSGANGGVRIIWSVGMQYPLDSFTIVF